MSPSTQLISMLDDFLQQRCLFDSLPLRLLGESTEVMTTVGAQ